MSTLKIQLPDSLYRSLQKLAEQDGISMDQFVALAIAEKIAALTTEHYLQERANRGDAKHFPFRGNQASYEAVLSKVPDVEPELDDKLPST